MKTAARFRASFFCRANSSNPGDVTEPHPGLGRSDTTVIPSSVEFIALDEVRHDDLPFYMNAANLVLTMFAFEASPIGIREAPACNVPVVSTPAGDVPTALFEMIESRFFFVVGRFLSSNSSR